MQSKETGKKQIVFPSITGHLTTGKVDKQHRDNMDVTNDQEKDKNANGIDIPGAVGSILDQYSSRQENSMKALSDNVTTSLSGLSQIFSATIKDLGTQIAQSVSAIQAASSSSSSGGSLQVPGDNTGGTPVHHVENRKNLLVPDQNAGKTPADHVESNHQNVRKTLGEINQNVDGRGLTESFRNKQTSAAEQQKMVDRGINQSHHRSHHSSDDQVSLPPSNSLSSRSKRSRSPSSSVVSDKPPSRKSKQDNIRDWVSSTKTTSVIDESPQCSSRTKYWAEQAEDGFEINQELGPEINSSIAGATKVFFRKRLNEEKSNKLLESSKIPGNCEFLKVLRANKEIWVNAPATVRTHDITLQKLQNLHGVTTSNVLRTADSLECVYEEVSNGYIRFLGKINSIREALAGEVSKDDISKLVGSLEESINQSSETITGQVSRAIDQNRDALILAGETNSLFNNTRRNAFRPSIKAELKGVTDEPAEEPEEFLFGDNLREKVSEIKGDNTVRKEFEKKKETPKKPITNKKWGGNERAPQKSRGSYEGYNNNNGEKSDYKKGGNYKRRSSQSNQDKPSKDRKPRHHSTQPKKNKKSYQRE